MIVYRYLKLLPLIFQLLEYTGRGKSIIDVGLAQARSPLDTTNHYFEIEIVDPGENCYIAIGLARRVSIHVIKQFWWQKSQSQSTLQNDHLCTVFQGI